jgi:HdeA/HdeB family
MNSKTAAVLLSGLLFACAQTQPPQAAAPSAPAPRAASAPAPAAGPAPASTAAAAPAQPPAAKSAPTNHIVNIRGARCQDLVRLSPEDRAAASMFYIGYQASRLRATTIDVGVIPSIEDQALVYCQENPNEAVAQAFAQAYLRTR